MYHNVLCMWCFVSCSHPTSAVMVSAMRMAEDTSGSSGCTRLLCECCDIAFWAHIAVSPRQKSRQILGCRASLCDCLTHGARDVGDGLILEDEEQLTQHLHMADEHPLTLPPGAYDGYKGNGSILHSVCRQHSLVPPRPRLYKQIVLDDHHHASISRTQHDKSLVLTPPTRRILHVVKPSQMQTSQPPEKSLRKIPPETDFIAPRAVARPPTTKHASHKTPRRSVSVPHTSLSHLAARSRPCPSVGLMSVQVCRALN